MKKILLISMLFLCLFSCKKIEKTNENSTAGNNDDINYPAPELNEKSASYLFHFAFDCIDQEYPNKLGQVLGDSTYLKEPSELHPAFYGCFDWHSSVHGHWTLLNLIKELPDFKERDSILIKLQKNITKENILKEITYFDDVHNSTFERTYGWAWLLKLAEELHTWNIPMARELESNLEPLTHLIIDKYIEFLPKLNCCVNKKIG